MKRHARPATPPPVEVHVKQQDILSAEADAIGCRVTPSLEPDDEASRRIFAAGGESLREDIRWAVAGRGAPLEPGEALTVPVRREYPVERVGFLILAVSAREPSRQGAEALVLGAFLREVLEWGFESVALPVCERGLGVTLPVATRLLARLSREKRPLPRRLQLLAREARLLDGLPGASA
jgi:O-acetyl-ADP-ribose deacetylase (regulator of RNase III)